MKKVIIVGATSGIGLELARQLIECGYRVGGCGRRKEVLNNLQQQLGSEFIGQILDIRKTDEIENALNRLIERIDGMDMCIITSGISQDNLLLDWAIEQNIIQTNIVGYAAVATFAARYFLRQRAGHLVGITSLTKYFANRSIPSYNASKVFASNYLDSLRYRLHGKNLYVTEIVPGFVDTPLLKNPDRTVMLIPVEKAVREMIRSIEKKKKVVIISRRWRLFRWILPVIPDVVYRKVT